MERLDNILLAFLNIKCYENPYGDSRGFYMERRRAATESVFEILVANSQETR